MAHFRGIIQGQRGEASRLGSRRSGLTVNACSWQGQVHVELSSRDGVDWAEVKLLPHHGTGIVKTLYDGPVGGK